MQYWPSICKPSLKPLKRLCRINPEVLPEHTLPDFEFDYIDIGSVFLSEGVVARERMTFADAPSRARKPVRKGDIIISTVRTYLRAIARIGDEDDGAIVSTGFAVCRAHRGVDPSFLFRVMQSEPFIEQVVASSTGVSYPAINPSTLGNITLPCPDLPTQKAIADFLDRETARIDLLIEKKQRLIEVVRERLLSELERLTSPEISLHDELIPFRWVCRITEGQVDPTSPEWADKPLIAPNHIKSRTGRLLGLKTASEQGAISGKYAFPTGTVVYSKIRPNLAKACVAPVEGMCSADMYPVLPDKRLRSQFLLMQLLSAKFTDWATLESMRVAMPKINRETLGSYRLWVPELKLQDAAIESFFAEQSKLDALTEKARSSIDGLREFRAALITAAVTGQINPETWSRRGTTDRRLDQIEAEMGA